MKFSLWLPTTTSWADLRDMATKAEADEWDGLWLADHFMANKPEPSDEPMHECLALLASLAAVVPRLRLGSLVLGNTYRHPAVAMKTAATIDEISQGRFVMGIGAGWQINEHAAYGIDLGSVKDRLSWFREACEIMVSLRDNQRTTVAGKRYQITDAPLEPKPVGDLPILIGAGGEKVMSKIVAQYADEWNTWATPEIFSSKTAAYSAACESLDRDPASLFRSTQALVFMGAEGAAKAAEVAKSRPAIGGTAEQLIDIMGQYADAGLNEFILPTFTATDPVQINEFAAEFNETVAKKLRT